MTTAGQFRKKPVVISAWLIDLDNAKPDWVAAAFAADTIDWCPTGEGLYINTLEGFMKGSMGDWLIRGVSSELYACKPEIFEATYEHAAPSAQASQPEAQPQWRLIETAPKDGRKLILAYTNRSNKPRTVMARWLTDGEAAETDADGVGLECGWYECIDNWDDYTEVAIHEGEPTHWMPLPAAPSAQAEQGGAK